MSDRVQFVVHPSIYDGDAGHLRAIYSDLNKAVRLDLRHHFSGPICANYWLSLCGAAAYSHTGLVDVIGTKVTEAFHTLKSSTPVRQVDLISLGPGNGEIDARLLWCLQRDFDSVAYFGIDVSFELLQHAVRRILNDRFLDKIEFPIHAIWGDFTKIDLVPHLHPENAAHLFCLTGFTLGNHNESSLIKGVGKALSPGDFLFLDARLHDLKTANGKFSREEVQSLTGGYAIDLSNRFAFGPVELVTTSTAADVTFGYDVNRNITAVPNAVNVITYCKDLHTRMRFTGEPIEMPRLNLGAATLYKYSDLVAWLPGKTFDLIWHSQAGGVGLFLLRKK